MLFGSFWPRYPNRSNRFQDWLELATIAMSESEFGGFDIVATDLGQHMNMDFSGQPSVAPGVGAPLDPDLIPIAYLDFDFNNMDKNSPAPSTVEKSEKTKEKGQMIGAKASSSSRANTKKQRPSTKAKAKAAKGRKVKVGSKQKVKGRVIKTGKSKRKATDASRSTKRNTAKGRQRVKREQRHKPSQEEEKLASKTPEIVFGDSHPLSQVFKWPERLMSSMLPSSDDKKLHVRIHTEFSGAATAEFALAAISAASQGKITEEAVSSADWAAVARKALQENTSPETHIFSDIAAIAPPDMKEKNSRMVPVDILISKADVLKAVGNPEYLGHMSGSDTEVGGDKTDVKWSVDGLFKKGKKRPSSPQDFGGMIRVRNVGTALKDYVLVKVKDVNAFWLLH